MMNPVLKSEQLQMGQFDPSQMGQFGFQMPQFYPNQMLPNPTLAGNAALNVDLSDYPTPQELEPETVSKVCKVDSNTDKNGELEIEEKGENNGEEIVQNPAKNEQKPVAAAADPVDAVHSMIPKTEQHIHGEPQKQPVGYDLLMQQ